MQPGPTLRALRDQPFELLLALEQRARDAATGERDGTAAQEWIGVAFRLGGETFLVARDEAREVMGVPVALTRVPGARPWIRGLANVRGQLLPVIDLRQYLGSGETNQGRNTRVIVVNHREIPAGLLVDEVLGFRHFGRHEFDAGTPPTLIRCEHYLAGSFRRGSEAWPVLSLRALVESPAFLQGSA
ncbi:MAG: purine-binding chemotaxis protein CheW [Gammaproteobacteria bacterium]|nr:purine-binding chemotaxis protein CheW [Gammaproteobacteria bacterium]MBM5811822.1 purine-binding chemotaxis protein CheW [Gammaproteobacteria bacterium]